MTAVEPALAPVAADRLAALGEPFAAFVGRHPEWFWIPEGTDPDDPPPVDPSRVTVLGADVLRAGRPGLLSVLATVDGAAAHAVLGLRVPGDEIRTLADVDESPLGIFEDEAGLAVVFDALGDAELAMTLLDVLLPEGAGMSRVRLAWRSAEALTLTFDDRVALTVFGPLPEGPHAGIELFFALDEVGFNHLPAPLARWRRGRHDLGIVHEYEAGATGGWALALTSLRDLYASGVAPERAGGDFAAEARELGVMTARMHLGLDQAFGRVAGDVGQWVSDVERVVRPVDAELLARPDVIELLDGLRAAPVRCSAIRTHGDFHLGRVARTDVGWMVFDFSPGGTPLLGAGTVPTDGPVFRSPMADVADMLWSFRHVAEVAATERDPSGRLDLSGLARAWETRNRRAFLAGYLETPGIGGLVPPVRDLVRRLAAAFELERTAAKLAVDI